MAKNDNLDKWLTGISAIDLSASPKKYTEVEILEKRWALLKIELEQLEDFYGRCECEDEINVIHDIQSLMTKIENGEY